MKKVNTPLHLSTEIKALSLIECMYTYEVQCSLLELTPITLNFKIKVSLTLRILQDIGST